MNNKKSITTSKLAVGESFTGSLVDINQGKFGPVYTFSIDGKDVTVFPSGNLKFLAEKIDKGEVAINAPLTITRTADIRTKAGFTATQFSIVDAANAATAGAGAATAAAASVTSVADKLAAIRAKRTSSGANSANS